MRISDPLEAIPVQNQGIAVGAFTALNFTGTGIAAADGGNGVANISVPVAPASGSDKAIQFNDGGVCGADDTFTYDKTLKSLAVGPGCIASGTGSFAAGVSSIASGPLGAVALGYSNSVSEVYGQAVGAYNVCSGVAATTIGEENTASGVNAIAIGFANVASGTLACAIGSYNVAVGTGSVALGMASGATRAGELAHSTMPGAQGLHAIDMYADLQGAPGNLKDCEGGPLLLNAFSVCSMRIRVIGVTTGGVKRSTEVHELLVCTSTGPVNIDADTVIAVGPQAGFCDQGWKVTFSAPGGCELAITCDPGTDRVRFFARVEWAEIGNIEM